MANLFDSGMVYLLDQSDLFRKRNPPRLHSPRIEPPAAPRTDQPSKNNGIIWVLVKEILLNRPSSLLEYHKDACGCQIPCQNLIFHHTNKQDTVNRKKKKGGGGD
jgi:hypothetical protein